MAMTDAVMNREVAVVFPVTCYPCTFRELRFGARGYRKAPRGQGGGQDLGIPGAWQGRTTAPVVIGQSKAGGTARFIAESADVFETFLTRVGLPVRFIVLARHPREMLGSMVKRLEMPSAEALAVLRRATGHVETAVDWIAPRFPELARHAAVIEALIGSSRVLRRYAAAGG